MTIADEAMAARAGAMVERWGGPAHLLRAGVMRTCIAAVLDYNPRANRLNLDGAERCLLDASTITIPPDHELDHLVKDGLEYRIVAPVKGPRPGGVVIYYDLDVLYMGEYAS